MTSVGNDSKERLYQSWKNSGDFPTVRFYTTGVGESYTEDENVSTDDLPPADQWLIFWCSGLRPLWVPAGLVTPGVPIYQVQLSQRTG